MGWEGIGAFVPWQNFYEHKNLPVLRSAIRRIEKKSLLLFNSLLLKKMGREGIEPPTQGFSVPCSTD